MEEAPHHPHNQARQTFVEIAGVMQPNVAPRFLRTPSAVQGPPPTIGANTQEALADWGFSADEIGGLKSTGAI
jgi:alpha-methylacyl-CoA racemase